MQRIGLKGGSTQMLLIFKRIPQLCFASDLPGPLQAWRESPRVMGRAWPRQLQVNNNVQFHGG